MTEREAIAKLARLVGDLCAEANWEYREDKARAIQQEFAPPCTHDSTLVCTWCYDTRLKP